MCQLYSFLANEPTKVECSLVRAQNTLLEQSCQPTSGRAPLAGWGIVCYDEEQKWRCPSFVRHITAANPSLHFNRDAEKVYSRAVVAHVRHATFGTISNLNTHPFTLDEWSFAHSGTIPRFDELQESMQRELWAHYADNRLGTSDSELFFLWLLQRLDQAGLNRQNIPERSEDAIHTLSDAIREMAARCEAKASNKSVGLSFVMTNGELMFACRWNSALYQLERRGVYNCEVCGVPHIHHDTTVEHRAAVFASEPITKEPWTEVPNYSLVYVSPEIVAHRVSIGNGVSSQVQA